MCSWALLPVWKHWKTVFIPQKISPFPVLYFIMNLLVLVCILLLWPAPWPKATWGRKGSFLCFSTHNPSLRKSGTQGGNLESSWSKTGEWKDAAYCLLRLLSYTTQDYLPQGTLPLIGWMPTSIITKKCLTDLPIWWRHFSLIEVPLPRWPWHVSSWQKSSQDTVYLHIMHILALCLDKFTEMPSIHKRWTNLVTYLF